MILRVSGFLGVFRLCELATTLPRTAGQPAGSPIRLISFSPHHIVRFEFRRSIFIECYTYFVFLDNILFEA